MSVATEIPAHIACERAHIGALGAFDLELGAISIRNTNDLQTVNLDFTGRYLDRLAFAGKIVSALAIDLDGGKLRWNLRNDTGVVRQQCLDIGARRAIIRGLGGNTFQIVR